MSAGTDAMLAWIASIYGIAAAQNVVNGMEVRLPSVFKRELNVVVV